jgi:hypothetical protein
VQQEYGLAPPLFNDMKGDPIRLDAPARPRGSVSDLHDSLWIYRTRCHAETLRLP